MNKELDRHFGYVDITNLSEIEECEDRIAPQSEAGYVDALVRIG